MTPTIGNNIRALSVGVPSYSSANFRNIEEMGVTHIITSINDLGDLTQFNSMVSTVNNCLESLADTDMKLIVVNPPYMALNGIAIDPLKYNKTTKLANATANLCNETNISGVCFDDFIIPNL